MCTIFFTQKKDKFATKKKNTMLSTRTVPAIPSSLTTQIQSKRGQRRPRSSRRRGRKDFAGTVGVLVGASRVVKDDDDDDDDDTKTPSWAHDTRAALSFAVATSFVLFTALPAHAGSTRFAGSFADPNHPGCPREITDKGLLRGYDPVPFEKGKGCRGRKIINKDDVFAYPGKTMSYWELKTKINKDDDEIFIDFDKKDGSGERVTAKLNEKNEIVFPTGEVWTRRRGDSFFP